VHVAHPAFRRGSHTGSGGPFCAKAAIHLRTQPFAWFPTALSCRRIAAFAQKRPPRKCRIFSPSFCCWCEGARGFLAATACVFGAGRLGGRGRFDSR
jgi:hypothetical protein